MNLPKSYVDGFLVEWEEGEYKAQVKSMRQKSEAIEPKVPNLRTGAGKGSGTKTTTERAQAVRDRLTRTVRKVPEVMVKITSSCKGMIQIGRHIDYISRKGQIELEDQDGLVVTGKEQLKELKAEWRIGGAEEIGEDSNRRDTLNIVFSMPAHTNEVSMKRAVRAFAAAEFNGHQYVFAYHTQATDPDPDPPAHPHVHLSVKIQGRSGRRLNPRKADLQRWREDFAAQLRAHGIEANATSRLARLRKDRGAKREMLAMTAEGRASRLPAQSVDDPLRANRAKKLEADRLDYYAKLAEILSRSEVPADRVLGGALVDHLGIDRRVAPGSRSREANFLPEKER
jgi:hypothetical protein